MMASKWQRLNPFRKDREDFVLIHSIFCLCQADAVAGRQFIEAAGTV